MPPFCDDGDDARTANLLDFLEKRKLRDAKNDKRQHTHLNMKGGKFCIEKEDVETFVGACAMEVHRGLTRYSLVEVNTPVTKLHFDVDWPQQVPDEVLTFFCMVLWEAVSEYFRAEHLMVACVTFSDLSFRERNGNGLHAIFPDLLVTAETARTVYAGAVARCEQKMSCFKGCWGDILDFAVLRENGSLRLVGFDKIQKCPACLNGPSRKDCDVCPSQSGFKWLKKIYWPWKVFPEEGERASKMLLELQSAGHAVKTCSIRSFGEPSKDFRRPPGAPLPLALTSRGCKSRKQGGSERALREDAEQLEVSEASLDRLTEAIRAYDVHYRDLAVVKVTRKRAERDIFDVAWVVVRGFNERFCLNKGAEHKSSNVYFQLSHMGLAQKCWCRKTSVGRSGSVCGRYTGHYRSVPHEVFVELLQRDAPASRRQKQPLALTFGAAGREEPQRPKRPRLEAPLTSFVTLDMYFFVTPDPF